MVVFMTPNPLFIEPESSDTYYFDEVSMDVDQEVKKLGGTKMVADRMINQFQVDGEFINTLRDKKITYGEMITVLAFAEQMPGGINEDNVDEIIHLRRGKWGDAGWEKVAGFLGIDIKPVLRRVKGFGMSLRAPQGDPNFI